MKNLLSPISMMSPVGNVLILTKNEFLHIGIKLDLHVLKEFLFLAQFGSTVLCLCTYETTQYVQGLIDIAVKTSMGFNSTPFHV